jgi:LuxR family maltose regulon positive regulatory protein
MSRGELQLIALLPSRASNADLATSLGVSVNTVKTRLRRLYSKLEARDRNEAIRKAQARGLLPPQ